MGRKSELSVRVNIDPVLDRDKFNEDVDKLTKTNPVPIHGEIDAKEALDSIADYQEKTKKMVPIVAKISNAKAALDKAFTNRDATPIKAELSAGSLAVIRGQLQDVIKSLDTQGTSSSQKTTAAKKNIKKAPENNQKKQSASVPSVNESSANHLKSKIESDIGTIAIENLYATPEGLKNLKEQVEKALSGVEVKTTLKNAERDPTRRAHTSSSMKTLFVDDDKILNQMAEAQTKATKSEESEMAAAKQKSIIYQNLVDHQAKAAENATDASAQTAKGLSSANKTMGDLNTKAEAFEQNWKQIVTLIAGATRDLTDLMVGEYGAAKGKGMEVFGAFQEFDKELPDLDTYDQKEYLAKIKNWANDLMSSVDGEFDPSVMQSAVHMFSGLADAWSKIDPSKLTDMVTMKGKKENVLRSMTELQNIFPSSTNGDPFWGAKESAINYLIDLLGSAAKYYTEVGSAAKQTADSIATANQGFANQAAQLEKTNAELEKAKQNIGNVSNSSLQTPISSDISEDSLSSFKIKIETGINPINITPEPTADSLAKLKTDIEAGISPIEVAVKQKDEPIAPAEEAEKPKKRSKKKIKPAADEAERLSFDSPELVVPKEEQNPIELPLPETPNYTKPSETLDDYRDSVGAAAGIQEYFAKEVDNATAALGSQSETLKALKKSLDEYTGAIDGVEKFAKAEKELDRLKKKLAQQQQQQPAQPAPQQPNNQPPAPIKPNNNPKPNNNRQPPAPPTPPNNQPPNNGGNNGGGNNLPVESQQKLEQALERIMTKMITAENKKDTSGDKGYGKNVAEQVKWQGQLHDRAEELIDKLNANYPGWEKGKSWQRHGENIAHVRDDYSTAREDKQDLDTVQKLGKELQRNLKLREELHKIDKKVEPVKYQNTQDNIKMSKVEIAKLRSEAKAKGLNTNEVTSDFLKSAAELQERITNKVNKNAAKAQADYVNDITSQYSQLESLYKRRISLFKPDQIDNLRDIDDEIKRINSDLAKTYAEAKQNGYDLTGNSDIQESIDNLSREKKISKRDFAKNQQQYNDTQIENLFDEYERLINKLQTYGQRRASSIGSDNVQAQSNVLRDYINTQTELNKLETEFKNRGFLKAGSAEWQQTYDLTEKRKDLEKAVEFEVNNRIQAEQEAIRVQDEDRLSLLAYIKTIEKYKDTLEKDNKTDSNAYGKSVGMSNAGWDLLNELNKNPDNKDQVAYLWGQKYNIQGVTDLESAFKALAVEAAKAGIEVQDLRTETEKIRATTQAKTNIANLKSQLMDYLEKFPKVEKSLAEPVQKLKEALADPNAYKDAGRLKQAMAELRAQAKSLGLESENLIDKFQKLFGQHLSTMITMAALHKMQDALRIVYQNVVEIDAAVTELRKVSEYAGKSLEEYMGRAAEQAQKLGVSISDYINSTADWKRLGYSDEDAENLATYSTLLRNVGDGIDDVNTSSSYLISTLQGFGLLADQAEDVVNKIDAVANTQPVTANDLGEILTRSSAAMSAANNTLEETIALGTAANAVIQDADTVGTTLKSLSMYLRAAKTDAENAGIEVDGMANSVSELRSELKSLTGIDIMLDSKNFKSTYQIMKELSQVWDNLSDVTQANVTEMIGGKRNANAVSAILGNFQVAESAMESAANSANVAWEENEKYLNSIQGRLAQLDASFQALSTDVLSSDLVKTGVSFLTTVVKLIDKLVNLTGALPAGLGIAAFATQLGEPKMTGFMIVPSNTPGGDTEQAHCSFYWRSAAREYLVKPTNMVA